MDGQLTPPADALNMSIEDIQRVIGGLTMHNIALQAEVTRLKNELANVQDRIVLDSALRGT
jgi:hypothetical protein